MNKSEIAEKATLNILAKLKNHRGHYYSHEFFEEAVERAIAESQAPQPDFAKLRKTQRTQDEDSVINPYRGDGEPSPPPATCKSCRTILYRTLGENGEYCDQCGAAQEVSPSASEIRSEDPQPSCHVCGEIMVKWKCLKCGAHTDCTNEEVSSPIPGVRSLTPEESKNLANYYKTIYSKVGVEKVSPPWHQGSKIPTNIYEGDRPICQTHTVADAKRIVESVNAVSKNLQQELAEAKGDLKSAVQDRDEFDKMHQEAEQDFRQAQARILELESEITALKGYQMNEKAVCPFTENPLNNPYGCYVDNQTDYGVSPNCWVVHGEMCPRHVDEAS
jgi:hypothetical protein